MQIKTIRPISFLFSRAETRVAELSKYVMVGQELFREAVKNGLFITGPIHWHYFGFTGDLSKQFTLEISLPVGDVVGEYDGNFHFKRTSPFKCVSTVYEGMWQEIPGAYEMIDRFVKENDLKPASINREIYINVDLKDQRANSTEIQFGIE